MALANVPAATPAAAAPAAGLVFPAAAALALKQGQVLDARVVQLLGGNAVRLNIQGVLIDALAGAKLEAGTMLRVRVDGAGPSVRLAVLSSPTGAAAQPLSAAMSSQARLQPHPQPPPAQGQAPPPAAPPVAPGTSQSLQRLFGDVIRTLSEPAQAITQPQREAAARLLNLPSPGRLPAPAAPASSAPASSAPAQGPLNLPANSVAQLVAGMTQVLAQDGDGAVELVRQAAVRLLSLARPQGQSAPQQVVPATASATAQPPPAGNAVKALFASADLILAGNPKEVPAPVRTALQSLAATRQAVSGTLTGETVKNAVAASGLFGEARIAAGAMPQPAGDMKLALFVLRDAVRAWLGEDTRTRQPAADRPASTVKNAGTQAPARAEPPTGAAREMARVLLAQTDAALARIRVAQVAALPDRVDHGATVTSEQNGSLHVALPLSAGDRPGFLHMQIDPDGGGADEDGPRGWRVRFSLDTEPAGPAQAVLGLRGGEVSVSMWAERGETAAILAVHEPLLRDMLKQAGLEAGAVSIRRGKPAAQIWRGARLLDRRS